MTKETPNLVQMRGLVFDLLKGTSLKVILFHQVSSNLIFGSCLILIYACQMFWHEFFVLQGQYGPLLNMLYVCFYYIIRWLLYLWYCPNATLHMQLVCSTLVSVQALACGQMLVNHEFTHTRMCFTRKIAHTYLCVLHSRIYTNILKVCLVYQVCIHT